MKLQKLSLYLLYLIPILFLPLTQDFYDTNKWMFLAVIALFALLLTGISVLRAREVTISLSPVSAGLAAITLASVLSTVISSPDKIEALANPFGPVTFAGLTILSLVLPPILRDAKSKQYAVWSVFGVTSLLAVIAIYQFFGMGKVMFPGVSFLTDPLWTPTGSTIATLTIFVLTLPLLIAHIRHSAGQKAELALSLTILSAVLIVVALGMTVWQLVSRIAGTILPLWDGWAIMLEILKNPRHAIFGVGADNFLAAFSVGRPASFNLSPLWSVRFTSNASLLFHIVTIYGLLGAAAFVLFAKSMLGKTENKSLRISLVLALLAFLVTPPNFSVLIIVFILCVIAAVNHRHMTLHFAARSLLPRILVSLGILVVLAASSYFLVRGYRAELTFYQSLSLAKQNNGTATYNAQMEAIKLNPYISRYHIIFSQTNMALATSVANSLQTRAKDPKASQDSLNKDRQLAAQLIQQSIAESKAAVALNQSNILAWENLARTYTQLIGVAQGADTWSQAAYQQATQLDPTNPVLHLELGGVYIQTKNYTQAITEYERAVALKPDYANAYYNLANALKLHNDITQAVTALEQAQKLVDPKSDDYRTVSKELEDLKKSEESSGTSPSGATPAPKPSPTPFLSPLALPTASVTPKK